MKAVSYIRVSTTDQKLSPDAQRKRIADLCAAREWELVAEYADIGLTGRNDARPQLQLALAAVCEQQAVLVCYSLSRVSRSAGDAEKICARIQGCGASLASCTEPIDTTSAMGRAFFGIVSVFARLESDLISERVKAVNDDTVRRLGFRTQGMQPFGYDFKDGKRVPVHREQRLIRLVLAAREKFPEASYAWLAKRFTQRKYPTPSVVRGADGPCAWRGETVRRIVMAHLRLEVE